MLILLQSPTCDNHSMEWQGTKNEAIGARLIILRKALGLSSSAAFAARTGLTPAALSNYENGFRRPNIEQAVQICTRTGVTLDWIYRGEISGLPVNLAESIDRIISPSAKTGS